MLLHTMLISREVTTKHLPSKTSVFVFVNIYLQMQY